MNFRLKSLFSGIAAFGLIVGGFTVPAKAVGETFDIALAGDNLAGSISGFDPQATLRMALVSSMGTLSWNNQGSNASLVSNSGNNSQGLWLEGTADQLTAALGEVTVFKPCAGNYTIYAQVSADGLLQNPLNGHFYKTVYNPLYYNDAFNEAQNIPLQAGGTDTFGYLATVTEPIENILVSNLLQSGAWFGATDRDVEGDWTWISGPEAGQVFYRGMADQGGAAVDGKFNNWNDGEPNDSSNEDYPEMLDNGTWNDIPDSTRFYSIEWGGMPGDNLANSTVATDSIDITITSAIEGSGTDQDPYLVDDVAALSAVSGCSGQGVHFLQTEDITLPANWAGDGSLNGFYDGSGYEISYSPNTVVSHDSFGIWAQAGTSYETEVRNLWISGDLDATGYNRVGLLFGDSDANILYTHVSGSIIVSDERQYIGGLVGRQWRDIRDVTSTVNITGGAADYMGGVAGEMDATMTRVTWSGSINIDSQDQNYNYYLGGVAGLMDCGGMESSSSTGSITVTGFYYGVGGLVGNGCGWMADSHSSVEISANQSTNVGGLIGETDSEIWRSFATGDVSADSGVGGLIGVAVGNDIYNNYARGDVTAITYGGSLFGELRWSWVENMYGTGHVTAGESRGAIGRYNGDPSLQGVHWSPVQAAVDVPGDLHNGEVPYTDEEATDLAYYQNDGWDISTNWDEGYAWTICAAFNDGYPFLTASSEQNPCLIEQSLTPFSEISGTGVEGDVLTGTTGTWDAGTTQTYQWRRNNTPIAGATTTTYTPVVGDVGSSITFVVLSTKPGYIDVVRYSVGKTITAKPVDEEVVPVVAPIKKNNLGIVVSGFGKNAWWVPKGFHTSIKKAVKAHSKATVVTCVGIVSTS
jgi:hypothetical protein